jgi:hypothetical protein
LNFQSIKEIREDLMHLTLNLYEYMQWEDPRLRYEHRINDFNKYLLNSRIDMTDSRYEMWLPNIAYTEENMNHNKSEVCYVYPNGTVIFYKHMTLTITCEFNYTNIPLDNHNCSTTAYIQNEF